MIELRPYQNSMLDEARGLIRDGCRRLLLQSPTGSGKTMLAATMLGGSAQRGLRSWFVVHRRELLQQSSEKFGEVGIGHSFIAADFPYDRRAQVHLCSVQTLRRRIETLPAPDIIVWDEAHHCVAETYAAIADRLKRTIHVGLSATPERLDGRGLISQFGRMIHGPAVRWLIDQKFLSDYRIFAPGGGVDMSGVRTIAGDYDKGETRKRIDKPSITGDAIAHYRQHCPGASFIAFCASIEHSRHVAEQFTAAGIPCRHVDGDTPREVREQAMADLRARRVLGLTNVDLFGEGVDVPDLHAVILLRPTQSRAIYFQQVGRALRPAANKPHAIILDHAGNSLHLGLPDDDIAWSLEGRGAKKKGLKPEVTTKLCKQCFAVVRAHVAQCQCGYRFVAQPRPVREVEGVLEEVDTAAVRQARQGDREVQAARTLDKLLEVGKQRGYAPGWAWHVMQARQRRMGGGT